MSDLLPACEAILAENAFSQVNPDEKQNLPHGIAAEQIWYRSGTTGTQAIVLEPTNKPEMVLMQRATYSPPDRGDNHGTWSLHRQNVVVTPEDDFITQVNNLIFKSLS